ncbi:Hypothetical protein CINCED_3A007497 [Cinara cedri]|uniref:Uncharacterized protein n=1 Tax=Cinara cedri TaxID=506608 RepID=A0A5E4MZZ8_9HEMI|nr:Hypothetical protein CINCED_3A007497 [Cinara cedri]
MVDSTSGALMASSRREEVKETSALIRKNQGRIEDEGGELTLINNLMSSTNIRALAVVRLSLREFKNKMKRSGLKLKPCGTPEEMKDRANEILLTETNCFLPLRYDEIQERRELSRTLMKSL